MSDGGPTAVSSFFSPIKRARERPKGGKEEIKEEEGRWKIGGRRKKETGRTRGATNRHAIPR